MLDYIQDILLILLIMFQFVVMGYLLFTTHQRYKEDKKFWKKQDEISEEFLKQLQEQPAVCLCEDDVKSEEEVEIEQKDTDKK